MWTKAMNKLLLIGAAAAAGALIATPTVVGLSGNTSFSRDLRVPVPSGAHHVQPVDLSPSASRSPTEDATSHARDDRGGVEDHPGRHVAPSDATDDHGGLRTSDSTRSGDGSPGTDDHSGGGNDRSGRSGGRDG
jgi:hypothetical protein